MALSWRKFKFLRSFKKYSHALRVPKSTGWSLPSSCLVLVLIGNYHMAHEICRIFNTNGSHLLENLGLCFPLIRPAIQNTNYIRDFLYPFLDELWSMWLKCDLLKYTSWFYTWFMYVVIMSESLLLTFCRLWKVSFLYQ